MKCELLKTCQFFNTTELENQPCIVAQLKSIYCDGNALLCARRRIAHALGRDRVPVDLHPDHTHLVPELIANGMHND